MTSWVVETFTAALKQIADSGREGCLCDHSTVDCCAVVGEFCSRCIAAKALTDSHRVVDWRARLFHGGKST